MLVIISCLDLVPGKCFPMEKAVGFGGSTSLIFWLYLEGFHWLLFLANPV